MILENEMIHGSFVRSWPTRLRRPRQPTHQTERSPAPKTGPTVEPGPPQGEWDISARDYRAAHPGPPLKALIPYETPIVPYALAQMVCEEAGRWLDVTLPREWIAELAEHAEVVYQHNPRFRRWLRRPGNAGRDCLQAFTRHWLYAMLDSRRPDLLSRLPSSYAMGRSLPCHNESTV